MEIFQEQQELSLEYMKKVSQEDLSTVEKDPNAQMLQMIIDQAKMHDQVYFKTGVENEEFENALMYFVLNQDEEVQAEMKKYMEKMQKELASASGSSAK